MGIFYNPPQPPTANNAGTPAEPHVPIGTQGSQPARYSNAVMLVAVLASWPTNTLEPRLQRPNDQQQKIAPLTLTYGQQPPNAGTFVQLEYAQSVTAWQPDPQPQMVRPRVVVPPGPQVVPGSRFPYNTLHASWSTPVVRVDQTNSIAPLTLPVGDRPAVAPISNAGMVAISANVAPTWGAQRSPQIAPLTLPTGDQPPVLARQIPLGAWTSDWSAQSAPDSTAWNATATFVPSVPLPRAILTAWDSIWTVPQSASPSAGWNVPAITGFVPAPPLQRALWSAWEPVWVTSGVSAKIAPLTLVYGDQPAPRRRVDITWPALDWPTQSEGDSAWNAPVLGSVPYTALPKALWTAWEPAPPSVQRLVAIAPLTLAAGDQPPVRGVANVYAAMLAGARVDNPAQSAPPNAGWNVPQPSSAPYAPLPRSIWTLWQPLWVQPPVPVSIAPLTLRYGTQVPVGAPKYALIYSTWPANLEPRLGAPNERRVKVAPLTLTYGQQVVVGTRAITRDVIRSAWPLSLEPRLGYPNERQQKVAPLAVFHKPIIGFRTLALLLPKSTLVGTARVQSTVSLLPKTSMLDIGSVHSMSESGNQLGTYARTVLASSPIYYWRMGTVSAGSGLSTLLPNLGYGEQRLSGHITGSVEFVSGLIASDADRAIRAIGTNIALNAQPGTGGPDFTYEAWLRYDETRRLRFGDRAAITAKIGDVFHLDQPLVDFGGLPMVGPWELGVNPGVAQYTGAGTFDGFNIWTDVPDSGPEGWPYVITGTGVSGPSAVGNTVDGPSSNSTLVWGGFPIMAVGDKFATSLGYSLDRHFQFVCDAAAFGGSSLTLTSTTLPIVGATYHIVVTRANTNVGALTADYALYVNGVLEASIIGGSFNPVDLHPRPRISGVRSGSPMTPIDGVIDEVTMYERALPAGEVAAHHQAGLTGLSPRTGSNAIVRTLRVIP